MFWTADDGTIVNTDHIVAIRPEEKRYGIVTLHMVTPGVTIDISNKSFIDLKLCLDQGYADKLDS